MAEVSKTDPLRYSENVEERLMNQPVAYPQAQQSYTSQQQQVTPVVPPVQPTPPVQPPVTPSVPTVVPHETTSGQQVPCCSTGWMGTHTHEVTPSETTSTRLISLLIFILFNLYFSHF
jgi:hypothetical protein